MRPVIVEAALNGITSRRRNPHVPVTPMELAEDAIACIDAGAAIVHAHAHNLGAPVEDLTAAYAECYQAVLDERPDAVLYPTIGLGATASERFGHVERLADAGLIQATFLDPGSVNLGGAGDDGLPPPIEYVYTNTFADTRDAFELASARRLGPSIAVFEPGFLQVVLAYNDAGALPPGTLVKLYFAAGGYLTPGRPLWGAPPIAEALALYVAMLGDRPIPWAVAVVGGDLVGSDILDPALDQGAHVRVGLEDHADGPPNVEQVAAVVARIEAHGDRPATPAEARALLQLG